MERQKYARQVYWIYNDEDGISNKMGINGTNMKDTNQDETEPCSYVPQSTAKPSSLAIALTKSLSTPSFLEMELMRLPFFFSFSSSPSWLIGVRGGNRRGSEVDLLRPLPASSTRGLMGFLRRRGENWLSLDEREDFVEWYLVPAAEEAEGGVSML